MVSKQNNHSDILTNISRTFHREWKHVRTYSDVINTYTDRLRVLCLHHQHLFAVGETTSVAAHIWHSVKSTRAMPLLLDNEHEALQQVD